MSNPFNHTSSTFIFVIFSYYIINKSKYTSYSLVKYLLLFLYFPISMVITTTKKVSVIKKSAPLLFKMMHATAIIISIRRNNFSFFLKYLVFFSINFSVYIFNRIQCINNYFQNKQCNK